MSQRNYSCDKCLRKLSTKLGYEWRRLATHLNIQNAALERISMSCPFNVENQIFAMLSSWHRGCEKTGAAKREALAQALREAERTDLCQLIMGTWHICGESDDYIVPESPPLHLPHPLQPESARYQKSPPVSPQHVPMELEEAFPTEETDHDYKHVKVKPWTNMETYQELNDDPEVYKMSASPRGYAIIINIAESRWWNEPRAGSEVDQYRIEQLFQQLDFVPIIPGPRDLNRVDIKTMLLKVSKDEKLKGHDCLAVVFMSHGQQKEIITADGKCLKLEEIFDMFSNANCPALSGKPKIFLVQACRGTSENRAADEFEDVKSDDASSCHLDVPEGSDILVVNSTIKGFKSYLNSKNGSWFIGTIVDYFAEHCCKFDVLKMFTRVNGRVTDKRGQQDVKKGTGLDEYYVSEDVRQCIEVKHSLRKDLYLFAGIKEGQ